jgi:hypothetical protein
MKFILIFIIEFKLDVQYNCDNFINNNLDRVL